jgi:hypothetical protein
MPAEGSRRTLQLAIDLQRGLNDVPTIEATPGRPPSRVWASSPGTSVSLLIVFFQETLARQLAASPSHDRGVTQQIADLGERYAALGEQ